MKIDPCRSIFIVCAAFVLLPSLSAQQETHTFKATTKSVAWGYYDAKVTPVLLVKPGDAVC